MNKDYSQLNRDHAGEMLDELERLQCHPRMTGNGECIAHCPFHDDEHPSFSLNMERGIFCCHAPCGAQGTYWDFYALLDRENFCSSIRAKDRNAPILKKEQKIERQRLFRHIDSYNKNPTPLGVSRAEVAQCMEEMHDYWHEYLMERSRDVRLMVTDEYEGTCTRSYFEKKSHTTKARSIAYVSPRFALSTVARFRIGYAPESSVELISRLKKTYSEDVIIGTGLVRKHGGFGLITPFSGRIVYPYLHDMMPHYAIARLTPHTPVNLADCKYLKQRTRDRKHTFPFPNPALFNEDLLHSTNRILITEGITDAIKACEANIPAISPVTIFFKKDCLDSIARILQNKEVVICNDTEASGAGELGMKVMVAELRSRGVQVLPAILPMRSDRRKVDVCSFINEMGAAAFHEIIEQQTGITFRQKQ